MSQTTTFCTFYSVQEVSPSVQVLVIHVVFMFDGSQFCAALKVVLRKESSFIFSHFSNFPCRAAGPTAIASDSSG